MRVMNLPDPVHQFIDAVQAAVLDHGLFPLRKTCDDHAEPVIVGVSGGPDSVALLHVLVSVGVCGKSLRPFPRFAIAPIVAHLNHGLRGEAADEDQRFVEALAAGLNLPCETARADVQAEAAAAGVGLEEAGRAARRRFFIDVARRHGAKKIALGHHSDDRIETVLFRILRGTGPEGLAAMAARVPLLEEKGLSIVRPLIGASRGLIETYLMMTGKDCRHDATNDSDAHTRNRVRNELLPLLRREFNPRVDDALSRLADQSADACEVLADAIDDTWRRIVREVAADFVAVEPAAEAAGYPQPRQTRPASGAANCKAIVIDADDFASLRPWMQGAILRRAVSRLGGGLKHMSADRTREVVSALLSKPVAGPVALPGGLVAVRHRQAIRIENAVSPP